MSRFARARAPGKVVLSGAYAVLEGAPALVAAVDRYAVADASSPSTMLPLSPELAAAFGAQPSPSVACPSVDSRQLYHGRHKLGLGSSAAVLVSALLAAYPDLHAQPEALFARAYVAHQAAQGGGSGVDIAASVWGGVQRFVRTGAARLASVQPAALPTDLQIVGYFSGTSARTADLLAQVRAYAQSAPARYRLLMDALCTESERCALHASSARELVERMAGYGRALGALGAASAAPIVPAAFARLSAVAEAESRTSHGAATFVGAGAGGGDLALFVGLSAPSAAFEQLAEQLGFERLDLTFGVAGAALLSPPD